MALTALEIKDKTFGVKFRGYDANEVEEFLDIVVRDYEDLVRLNHDQEAKIQALEERLNYFDEMKDSLSQSVLIAQDTAERVKQAANERSENIVRQAEQDAQHLVDEAKQKANEILRHATDNAKKVAVETEELKNKTRVFHQRLKSTIESQLTLSIRLNGMKFFAQQLCIFKQVMKLSVKLLRKLWVNLFTIIMQKMITLI